MKRIISILLALILCLFACEKQEDTSTDNGATDGSDGAVNNVGDIDLGDDSDVAGLLNAFANTLSQDSFTITVDLSEDVEASIPTVDVKADLKNAAFIASYVETYNGISERCTVGYDDMVSYECLQEENYLPRGRANELDSENSATAIRLLTSVLEDRSQLTAENIAQFLSSFVLGYSEENPIASHIAAYALKSLADEEWLSDLAGLSVTRDGNVETYTVTPDIYGIANDLLTYLDGKIDSETLAAAKESLEDEKDGFNSVIFTATVEVTDGLLSKAQLGYNLTNAVNEGHAVSRTASATQSGTMMSKTKLSFSDYGTTVTPIDELKKTINDAHNGHDKCVKCGDEAYFSCYCFSCSYDIFCPNYCGNLRTEDNVYCDECYVPCKDCGEEYGRYDGYCYSCYDKRHCQNCDNAPVHFPNGSEYGYCDDCYTPCPDCGEQGEEYCNGYCYDCCISKYCSLCKEKTITHQFEYEGYCDDCYDPCPGCGEQGSEYYNGYCHKCARNIYCRNCYVNEITVTDSDGNGYCDDCYTKCAECGEVLREIINGVCYECYYNKYCHECGKNEITHGTGTEHKLCDECYG